MSQLRAEHSRKLAAYLLLFILVPIPLSSLFLPDAVESATIEVCFTPGDDCTGRIVRAINTAQSAILIQAYSFTSAPIAKALVTAHKRGVRVEVILDKSQRKEKYTSADFIAHAGIPTFIDSEHAIAHNKILILDATKVITGSFNFSKAAQQKNAENLLVIQDAALAKEYMENWRLHRSHSERYRGK
ncbi:MAG: phospholipase D family protein (plasmid) [Candidatus Manganitrophus sp.]|nr:phospholipase D family protein [Candidatus Manganitrophus sp.]MDC4228272.1 phospholipase D family protein [Candidatus Manganitrophus sp.]WDT73474.1 MAG: phospholipase D family protein [Candidatus Manganitrophus sp.]